MFMVMLVGVAHQRLHRFHILIILGKKRRKCVTEYVPTDVLGDLCPFPCLCMANCYFAHDSSGFPVLLLFFDAQSGRSCYPLDRHAGPVARTWWRPFPGRGVASPETPAPDRESLPATIAQSIRGGPHPCRLAGALGASNPPSPFRNCTETLDTASLDLHE